jgi:arginyl-tRNA synthetase
VVFICPTRICSILDKVVDDGQERAPLHIRLDVPAERALAIELIQFPHTAERAAQTLRPHGLCQYLFKLATAFTGFYETCLGAQG